MEKTQLFNQKQNNHHKKYETYSIFTKTRKQNLWKKTILTPKHKNEELILKFLEARSIFNFAIADMISNLYKVDKPDSISNSPIPTVKKKIRSRNDGKNEHQCT